MRLPQIVQLSFHFLSRSRGRSHERSLEESAVKPSFGSRPFMRGRKRTREPESTPESKISERARLRGVGTLLAMLFVFALLSPTPPVAHATSTTRYVSTTGSDTSNDCSNSSTPCATIAHAISQSSVGDTIQVAAGTYTEHGITVDKDLTISGQHASDTVVQAAATPAAATDRVFTINSGVTATLQNLTIQNGKGPDCYRYNCGGGIYNRGTLNLTNSTVSNNSVSGSSRLNSGGGIHNEAGTVNILNSTISNNWAGESLGDFINDGGGVFNNQGTVNILNSTISNNSARGRGSFNYGGGIANNYGVLNIANSTLSNNSASGGSDTNAGGGIGTDGHVNVVNSTLSGNSVSGGSTNQGGGFYFSYVMLNLKNSIVTNSTGGDCYQVGGTVGGSNNRSDGSCPGTRSRKGNVTNFDTTLKDNGGPTQTHALLARSNAIDAVPSGQCTYISSGTNPLFTAGTTIPTDQRGVTRPQDGNGDGNALCDIGSYEAPPVLVVQDSDPAVQYAPSWREVSDAHASGGTYHVSGKVNASAKLVFNGSSISWITAKGPHYGIAQVYLDGTLRRTVDLYRSTQKWQALVHVTAGDAGQHTIEVRVTHTKNPASEGYGIVVDAFRGYITLPSNPTVLRAAP